MGRVVQPSSFLQPVELLKLRSGGHVIDVNEINELKTKAEINKYLKLNLDKDINLKDTLAVFVPAPFVKKMESLRTKKDQKYWQSYKKSLCYIINHIVSLAEQWNKNQNKDKMDFDQELLAKGYYYYSVRDLICTKTKYYRQHFEFLKRNKVIDYVLIDRVKHRGMSGKGGNSYMIKTIETYINQPKIEVKGLNRNITSMKERAIKLILSQQDEALGRPALKFYKSVELPTIEEMQKVIEEKYVNSEGKRLYWHRIANNYTRNRFKNYPEKFVDLSATIEKLVSMRNLDWWEWDLPSYSKKEMDTEAEKTRIYSWITNVPKYLRKLIKIDGEEIAEADLKSAHVLFLVDVAKDRGVNANDFKQWILDNKYDVYSAIAKDQNCSRNEIKTNMVSYINTSVINMTGSKYSKIDNFFKTRFPQIHRMLIEIKTENREYEDHIGVKGNEYKKSVSHKAMSRILLKLESSLINPLLARGCGLGLFDGIICIKKHVKAVSEAINAMAKRLGLFAYSECKAF